MPSNVLMFEFLAVDHFAPVAEHVSRKLDGIGERMGAIGKVAALAIGKVAVGGLAAFGFEMVKGVQAAAEYQTLQLKTAAVIKSTGNQAHITVRGIDELAHSLQETSGVSEMLIINSENVLATFTNIRNSAGKNNDIYDQATSRILDLSVAMGEDLQSATVQVGKALNNPIKGMTALQRVGVTFTAGQKEQIKKLTESGHLMEAQKIILKELSKEFGGAAKAAGAGFGGAMARVKNALEDTFRDMGLKLLPALTKVANWFADRLPGAIKFLGGILGRLGSWLGVVARWFIGMAKTYLPPVIALIRSFTGFLGTMVQKYGPAVLGFLKEIANRFSGLLHTKVVFAAISGALTGLLIPVLGVLVGVLASVAVAMWAVISPLLPFLAIGAAVGAVAYLIVSNWSKVSAIFRIFAPIVSVVSHYFSDLLMPALREAAAKVFPQLRTAIATIGAAFRDHMDVIRTFGQVFMFILKALGVALAILALTLVKVVIPVIAELIVTVLRAVGPIVRALLTITGALINVIKGMVAFAVQAVKTTANIIGDILGAFSNAKSWLLKAGGNIISGLISGIIAIAPHILVALGHVIDFILGPFKPALIWLVVTGKNLLLGLIHGIAALTTTVAKAVSSFIHDKLIGPFSTAKAWLLSAGKNFLTGLYNGILSFERTVLNKVLSIISTVIKYFAPARTWLVGAGQSIIRGLFNGIASAASAIRSFVNDHIVQPVIRWVKWFFGISSPSRVFISIGTALIQGLISGIRNMIGTLVNWVRSAATRVRNVFAGAAGWLFKAGFNVLWGFWQGLGAIWNRVKSWVGGIGTWIRNHKGPIALDARLLIPAGRAIMGGFLDGLKSGAGKAWDFVKSVGGKTVDVLRGIYSGMAPNGQGYAHQFQGGPIGSGAARWAPLVSRILKMEGLSPFLLTKVMRQLQLESGGNPNAINLWDSNAKAGHPSKGLMQTIPSTFAAYHWPGTSWNIYDPTANIAAALNYARHRYGPDLSALGQGHGYDQGGIARGRGWFGKFTNEPERILSPRQTEWFERAMHQGMRMGPRGHGGAVTLILNAPNYVGSRNELLDEFNRFARHGRLDQIVKMATR